jgi:hypothetical protein
MQGLGIGRIVHYHPGTDDPQFRSAEINRPVVVAAIITKIHNEEFGIISLTIFPDGYPCVSRAAVYHKSRFLNTSDFKEGLLSYWDWPEKK